MHQFVICVISPDEAGTSIFISQHAISRVLYRVCDAGATVHQRGQPGDTVQQHDHQNGVFITANIINSALALKGLTSIFRIKMCEYIICLVSSGEAGPSVPISQQVTGRVVNIGYDAQMLVLQTNKLAGLQQRRRDGAVVQQRGRARAMI